MNGLVYCHVAHKLLSEKQHSAGTITKFQNIYRKTLFQSQADNFSINHLLIIKANYYWCTQRQIVKCFWLLPLLLLLLLHHFLLLVFVFRWQPFIWKLLLRHFESWTFRFDAIYFHGDMNSKKRRTKKSIPSSLDRVKSMRIVHAHKNCHWNNPFISFDSLLMECFCSEFGVAMLLTLFNHVIKWLITVCQYPVPAINFDAIHLTFVRINYRWVLCKVEMAWTKSNPNHLSFPTEKFSRVRVRQQTRWNSFPVIKWINAKADFTAARTLYNYVLNINTKWCSK